MAEKEYIDREALLDDLDAAMKNSGMGYVVGQTMKRYIKRVPAADVAPVVRCKDCKWFVPKHILMDDGSTREYTEEEKKLPLGVPGNVGINCGSRCMRHISWLENSVPVWVQENDYCSYGERKEATP